MAEKSEKKPIYKQWWFWAIIVVALVAVGGAGSSSNNQSEENKPAETSKADDKADSSALQSKIEMYCEDYITPKIDSKTYALYSVANSYNDFGESGGWYTEDGRPIYYYRWWGKNKKTDAKVVFDCWVGADEKGEKISPMYISMVDEGTSKTTVVAGQKNYKRYDKDSKELK